MGPYYNVVPDSWATIEITNVTKGDALHEHKYILVCTVQITRGMKIVPDINWYSADGRVVETNERIAIRKDHSDTVVSLKLTFSPVLSDDGGEYTCRAQVTVPWMTTQPPVKLGSVNMPVTSKSVVACEYMTCLLYTSPSPRDATLSRMPSSA